MDDKVYVFKSKHCICVLKSSQKKTFIFIVSVLWKFLLLNSDKAK